MAKTLAAAVLVLMLCAFGTAHAGIIGFDPAPGSFGTYYAGSSFDGWTVTAGSVDWIGSYWQAPVVGQGSVDMDGYYQAGTIQRVLDTTQGQTYQVSFALSGNPDREPAVKVLNVAVGNYSNTFYYTLTGDHTNMNYVTETFDFTATANPNLVFASGDDPNNAFGPVIGNVQVSAVPVPPSVLLLAPGLLGFVGLRKRFKA